MIRVRRGALRRFDLLKQKSTGLPVEVTWDRRQASRRAQAPAVTGPERRASERRQEPPFTWDVADFVVVGDRSRVQTPDEDAPSQETDRREKLGE